MICRILCRIIVESCFEIFKSIIKLSNVAVISKLCNVKEIELDVFVIRDQFRATRINLTVIVKNQSMRNMRDNRALRSQQIAFHREILLNILISINKLQQSFVILQLILDSCFIDVKHCTDYMIVIKLIIHVDKDEM